LKIAQKKRDEIIWFYEGRYETCASTVEAVVTKSHTKTYVPYSATTYLKLAPNAAAYSK
jgi:hypothetical protein